MDFLEGNSAKIFITAVLRSLILTEDAQRDLDRAYEWYQDKKQGLGHEFMHCVDA